MNQLSQLADKIFGEAETDAPSKPIVDPNNQMHAIVWEGKKNLTYTEVPRPCITDPRDVILKVTACAICGSDLHLWKNTIPNMHAGDILGHEFMGIIQETGDKVENLQKGQRVVVSCIVACGTCEFCQRKEFSSCETTNPSRVAEAAYGSRTSALFGYSHMTGGVPGGQAEYVRVPYADFNCLPVPDELSDEKAVLLSDVIPTSYHATKLARVKPGCTVAIWGLGPIGLMTARWCQILKAARVIGIDCVQDRLELAKSHLGIEVIDFKQSNVEKTLKEMFPTGVDCGIECVGFDYPKTFMHKIEQALNLETDSADILTEIFRCVRKAGNVAIIGDYVGTANHFPIGTMMEKSLTVKGGQVPVHKYWKRCLQSLLDGDLDPSFIITHHGKLYDAPRLYKDFNKKQYVKIFLRP